MYVLKNVVDEVKDDFLEISLEDASKDGKNITLVTFMKFLSLPMN